MSQRRKRKKKNDAVVRLAYLHEQLENGWDSRFTRGTIPSLPDSSSPGDTNKSVNTSVRSSPSLLSSSLPPSSPSSLRPQHRQRRSTGPLHPTPSSSAKPKTTRSRRDVYRKKLRAKKAIGHRETLVAHLDHLVRRWPSSSTKQTKKVTRIKKNPSETSSSTSPSPTKSRHTMKKKNGVLLRHAEELLSKLASSLRKAGLKCVELVVSWVITVSGGSSSSHNTPFVWNGDDYLYGMHSDLDFVVDYLGEETARRFGFGRGNPLLLVGSRRRDGDGVGVGFPDDEFLERLSVAGLIIRDVVARREGSGGGGVVDGTRQRRSVTASSRVATIEEEEEGGSMKDESPPLVSSLSSSLPVQVVEAVSSSSYTMGSGAYDDEYYSDENDNSGVVSRIIIKRQKEVVLLPNPNPGQDAASLSAGTTRSSEAKEEEGGEYDNDTNYDDFESHSGDYSSYDNDVETTDSTERLDCHEEEKANHNAAKESLDHAFFSSTEEYDHDGDDTEDENYDESSFEEAHSQVTDYSEFSSNISHQENLSTS